MAGLANRHHRELLHHPYGLGDGSDQLAALGRNQGHAPRRSVVPGLHPARTLACGIVILPAENTAVSHGTLGHAPRTVADDRFARTVCIFNLRLENHLGVSEADKRLEIAFARHVIQPVAEHYAEDIGPALQLPGNVEGLVTNLLVVIAPRGIEEVVADLFAVQEQFELPQAAHIDHGPLHGLVQRHFAAELRQAVERRLAVADFNLVELLSRHHAQAVGQLLQSNPFGAAPVAPSEQADRKTVRFAPRRNMARLVGHPHTPVIAAAGLQRTTRITHMQRSVGFAPFVPQQFFTPLQIGGVGGDLNLVARLQEPAADGKGLPTELRRQGIDGQRIVPVIAPEFRGPEFARGNSPQASEQQRKQQ